MTAEQLQKAKELEQKIANAKESLAKAQQSNCIVLKDTASSGAISIMPGKIDAPGMCANDIALTVLSASFKEQVVAILQRELATLEQEFNEL